MTKSATGILAQHHLLWGAALGGAVVLGTQLLTWAGLGMSYLTWASTYLCVIVFAALAGRSLTRLLGKRPGFLQAVVMLVAMILLARLVYQIYMFVYINYVDPTWVDTAAEVWSRQLRESGTPEAKIEAQVTSFRGLWETRNVFTIGLIAFTLPQLMLGFISVVLAAVQPWKRSTETS